MFKNTMLKELEEICNAITSLNNDNTILVSKANTYPHIDENIVNHINNFLIKINGNLFELDCLEYVAFFDHNKVLINDFVSNLQELIKTKLMLENNKVVFKLSDNLEIFLSTRDMNLEFKEIFYNLLPNIKEELNFESKELRKLVAFNKIDLEDSKYTDEYSIEQLLELAQTGGNALFFSGSNRSSIISEKRLSLLSNQSNKLSDASKRKHMPIFLSKRDMMIFEDLLEIEKLNEALFRSLRELLSEKIEIFSSKHNNKKNIFNQLILVIKKEYLILDNGFEQLSYLLKSLEHKVTVIRWISLIDKLYDDCLGYIQRDISSLQKRNSVVLKEGIDIIQKHIKLFNDLLKVSWNEILFEKVLSCKNLLIAAWKETKQRLNIDEHDLITEESTTTNTVKNSKEKKTKKRISRRSIIISTDKQAPLTRAEKRQSIGAAFYQKLNLRASLISSDGQLKSPKKEETLSDNKSTDLDKTIHFEKDFFASSVDSTDEFLTKNQQLFIGNIQSEHLIFNDLLEGGESLDDLEAKLNEIDSTTNDFTKPNSIGHSSGNTLNKTNNTNQAISEESSNNKIESCNQLIINRDTLLKYAKMKTKIPKNEFLLGSLLENENDSFFSFSKNLLQQERNNMELVMDINRAYAIYDSFKTENYEDIKLLNIFNKLSI